MDELCNAENELASPFRVVGTRLVASCNFTFYAHVIFPAASKIGRSCINRERIC